MNIMYRFSALWFFLILGLSGCGNGFIPVGGKVVFEDGEPLTEGAICFSTDTFMANARIQSDGTFQLSSLKKEDGLPAGHYSVTIYSATMDEKDRTVYLIDPVFFDKDTTPLRAEVVPGTKHLEFQVYKNKK